MLSFETFLPEEGLPIYLQIIRHVKRGIAAGTVQAGDELPSRRVLSARLGVSPTPVHRNCGVLGEGVDIACRWGAKSEVALPPGTVEQVRSQLLEQEAGLLVRALLQAGLDKGAAFALLDRLWEEAKEETP